jgi:hypothetical protein
MPYSQPPIEFSQNNFSIQANAVSPSVIVKYDGSGIHDIAGPVPFVSLSKSINRNSVGDIENISTNINLTGKIVRYNPEIFNDPYGSGIRSIVKAVDDLRSIFTSCPISTFEILCDNSPVLSVGGVRVKSFSTDKSQDNWVYTADYTVELEYFEPPYPNAPLVTNMSDSWSIEPLEDYVYNSFSQNIHQRIESHNPNLNSEGQGGTSLNATPNGTNSYINIINVPQFRISHKISAVGIAPTGIEGVDPSVCASGLGNRAYLQAKKWVEQRAGVSLQYSPHSSNVSGLKDTPHFTDAAMLSSFTSTFLYNHVRNINFSITDANYEINDTWLAMPTGIKYTEDYSIEVSTDEKFTKSIRVQGNIKGLSLASFDLQQAKNGSGLVPNNDGKIDISFSSQNQTAGTLSGSNSILDLANNTTTTLGRTSTLSANKYENALDAWMVHIKPYLYKRACMGINSTDRDHDYTEYRTTRNNQPVLPFNPVYSRENLLNIIPKSTTEGHDPRKGTISYSYEYHNTPMLISGVISENISISNTAPTDVVSQTQVLGRELGPILQKTGKTPTTTSFTLDVVVVPPKTARGFLQTQLECPLYTGGYIYQQINSLIESFKPFGNLDNNIFSNTTRNQNGTVDTESDGESWSPTNGHYSRNITWIYQRCSVSTNYMDH